MSLHLLHVLASINIALSMVIVSLLVHHMHKHVTVATALRTRLFLIGLVVYFLFQVTGSALYLSGFSLPARATDSLIVSLLCNYRPSRLHIVMTLLGLIAATWVHHHGTTFTNRMKRM